MNKQTQKSGPILRCLGQDNTCAEITLSGAVRTIDPRVVVEPGSASIVHDPERILSQVLLYEKDVAKKKNLEWVV